MKKILILGGSHRDIPLIKASKKLGFYVITLGDRDYYLGHSYADKYYKLNFNDLDDVKQVIKGESVDYLIPGSGEESYLNTVMLAHELGIGNFDDIEVAELVHNKWRFKEFCLSHQIATPYGFYYHNDTDLENLSFPMVVKPTSLSGGRGVEVVYDLERLKDALRRAEEVSGEIFLEEYIDGELYAYSVFIKDQKLLYGFLGKDDTYLNKYLITTAYPAVLKENTLSGLQKDIETIAKKLSLVDGMFHLQVLVKNDIAYIIDVTRRIPGDLYPDLIEYCDHVSYSRAVIKSYIGLPIESEFAPQGKRNFVIRHCVMADKNGTFNDIIIDESIKQKIIGRLDLLEKGARIENYLSTQIAILFVKADDFQNKTAVDINKLVYPDINMEDHYV